jgi:hypothetical protein
MESNCSDNLQMSFHYQIHDEIWGFLLELKLLQLQML